MADDPQHRNIDVAAASPMPGAPQVKLGIVGTFDVENYGDLLFPLLARAELSRRLPAAAITAFSYNARSGPQWPYDVRPVASLADGGSELAGLLIGGGQLVRTDAYFPIPVPAGTVVPYDVWLFPALAALALRIPFVWNAIGAWEKGVAFPPAVREMFAAAVRGSDRVAVRDAISVQVFDAVAGTPVARQVPDTGFGLRRLVDPAMPSAAYAEWRRLHGIAGPYVAIQATVHLAPARAALHHLRTILPDAKFVLLPICKVHGDSGSLPHFAGIDAIADDRFVAPELFAEIIAHSMLAIGSSLHFGITAIAFGVPLLRTGGYDDRKYQVLDAFDGAQALRADITRDGIAQLAAGARTDPRVVDHARQVDRHWDATADVFDAGRAAAAGEPDRRTFAEWTLRAARRQVASFESAAVRFRHA